MLRTNDAQTQKSSTTIDDKPIGIHPGCTPQSREAEREELRRLMAEWEEKNGPIVTQPIVAFKDNPKAYVI